MSAGQNRVILVVNGSSYAKPFAKLAAEKGLSFSFSPKIIFEQPEQVALVVFTGGEDVSPDLYSRSKHSTTCNSRARDMEEMEIFEVARENQIPMAGICRGAQFLCVMAGGRLVQDITGHSGYHKLQVDIGNDETREVEVNSSHHQMQYPFDMAEADYEVIGYMAEPRSRHYAFDCETTVKARDADSKLKSEPDIVFYPKIRALGAQYHPEWLNQEHEAYKLYEELLDIYLKPLIHEQVRARTA